jgi:arylsulfatase A-like enzyme
MGNNKTSRRNFLKRVSAGLGVLAAPNLLFQKNKESNTLNFIIINVDDLGWTDLSCQGSSYFETPHIDRLASQGMRFTDAYAACAVCSPTRAAIMTGRYPARVGITDWIRARFQGGEIGPDKAYPDEYIGDPDKKLLTPKNPLWMKHKEVTIADALEKEGYSSCHIGKWHLGADNWYPTKQGFDYNIGGCDLGEPPTYFDPYFREGPGDIPTLEPRKRGEYLTDRLSDEALQFIRENKDSPFFLHMAHYAVHTPIEGKESLIERYGQKPITKQDDPVYASMVHSVDQATGDILNTLDELNLTENTMIIFTSDNGGLEGPTNNYPLRSGKGFPYEGGIRVPTLIKWPGVVEPATVSYEPIISVDFFPTILDAAEIDLPDDHTIDGVSLKKHIQSGGKEKLDRKSLFWHFPHYRQGHTVPPYSIIRKGVWKLLKWYEGPEYELYNLKDDIGEKNNLAKYLPKKVEELKNELGKWIKKTNAKLPKKNPNYRG